MKITLRPIAVLQADFPNDAVEVDHEIIAGRNVAEALIKILRGLGYTVSDPEHQGLDGWHFAAQSKGPSISMLVQVIDDDLVYLDTAPPIPIWPAKTDMAAYADILERLNQALGQDPRFSNVLWSSRRANPPEDVPEPVSYEEEPPRSPSLLGRLFGRKAE